MNNWTQIRVACGIKDLDTVCAVMSMVDNGLMIEDANEVDTLDHCYGELIDESLINADRTVGAVSIYIPEERNPAECVSFIKEHLSGIEFDLTLSGMNEEDWADSWKQYYKPVRIGKKLIVVPSWEEYEADENDIVLMMDPGMAFGTGTHETTRLCAALLEKYITPGDKMLDVGCGSGILAICAAKLGAGDCFACDIDPVSVRIANENAEINETPNVHAEVSDLLRQVPKVDGGYEICCANIVADVIIRMAPDVGAYLADDAYLIVSGIITERAEEVVDALDRAGLKLHDELRENGWFAGVVVKK